MTSATLTLGSTSCRPLRGMSSTASSVMSAALLLTFTSVPPGPWVRSLHQRLGLTAGEPIDARQQGSFLVGLAEVVIHSQGPGPLAVLVAGARSEEHTSELQSRGHLVCRLLLEKKKARPDLQSRSPAERTY